MSENAGNPLGGQATEAGIPGLTETELETLRKVFSSPLDIPQEWKSWLVSYLEANPPVLPISQIFGFNQFTANFAKVAASQAIPGPAGAFYDLATVGPELTPLPKGKYVVLWGCNYDGTGGATGAMGYSINGAAPVLADAAQVAPTAAQRFNLMRADLVDLTLDANDIKMKYYSTQVGPLFANRWMIVLKYANL